jgi:hypothetical protein
LILFCEAAHQKEMIKEGILDQLIKSITSEKVPIQIKAFEVLLYFDGTFKCSSILIFSFPFPFTLNHTIVFLY